MVLPVLERSRSNKMNAGDIVRWTFTYNNYMSKNLGILLKPEALPVESWIVLLNDGRVIHADVTELEVINEHW